MYRLLKRIYTVRFPPPKPEKDKHCANALILAVRSHPGADVVAVAARNEQKARTFAQKHDIKGVYYGPTGYQELISDPNIDAIYNPLPNGLHFEWTAKALAAGKHVLLEKPSTDSSEETRILFQLAASKGLILLEAFHYRFHPAFRRLAEIVKGGELGKVKAVKSALAIPRGLIGDDDIRFDFDLGGGSLMDMGVYPISAVRFLASAEPTSVLTATHTPHRDRRIDRGAQATFAFPNDVTAEIECDMQVPWRLGIIPRWPNIHTTASLDLFPALHIYHSVTVTPKDGKKRVEKAYKPKEGAGEDWWTTYRYQLEAFVDKVRGRTPHEWISAEDSINQMKAVELVYEKLGLPLRPKSNHLA
ncbi:NAD(P)-binding protein [Gautieria morchelliformis]|nr:NAD(P)-binding protein [Gautieria morchelliformis]